jgi:hypothetical protein
MNDVPVTAEMWLRFRGLDGRVTKTVGGRV